ncbi:MAG TPA: rRNA maturation RNase YbeY [Steroidobacteraceae bacterium]|nr:rRNA maturation RNase YbeY [Steroidobacteraceae bacterium]
MRRARRNARPRNLEPRLSVEVSYAARRPWVPRPADLRRWATAAAATPAAPATLEVRVVGTARSRRLNERFRHKATPTNVLSFAGPGLTADGRIHLGELVICAPVVAREARTAGMPVAAHWAHMVVHGVLHLRGFDHERDAQARVMIAKEVQILDRLGFSNPYA